MRLHKVRVTNFRSVDDSEEFEIDPVTCLVGKNEAAKKCDPARVGSFEPERSDPSIDGQRARGS